MRGARGSFVVLVGPDGVGKTSVAKDLLRRVRNARYFHFRPSLRGWDRPEAGHVTEKGGDPLPWHGVPLGWLRLAVNLIRFWAGYLVMIRPALRRGSTVVADRWAFGYVADPVPLKFGGPERLARAALRIFPQPDLVACLVAPADVIHARKPELTVPETQRQLDAWSEVPARRKVVVDTTVPVSTVTDTILDALAAIG